jgi:tetratricopeptide (TPR) repeat protein
MQTVKPRQDVSAADIASARDAIGVFAAILESDPNNEEALWQRARAFADIGNHDAALRDLNRLIENDGANYAARVKRGDCLMAKGDVVNAFKDYAEAISQAPNRPEAYFARGLSLAEQYEFRDAISNFDKAITLAPRDAKLYRARARAQRSRASKVAAEGSGENITINANSAFGSGFDPTIMELAIRDFGHALALEDHPRTRLDRASTLESAERWEEALSDYQHVLQKSESEARENPHGEAAAIHRLASEGVREMQAYLGTRPAASKGQDPTRAVNLLAKQLEEVAAKPRVVTAVPPFADKSRREKPAPRPAAATIDTAALPPDAVVAPPAPAPDKPSPADLSAARRLAIRAHLYLAEPAGEFNKNDLARFGHLDRKRFYDAIKHGLERSQFKHIVDVEPMHLKRISGIKTLLRILVSPSGRSIAFAYELYTPPEGGMQRLLASVFGKVADRLKVMEIVSEFSNGAYVITDNLEKLDPFDPPPGFDVHHMAPDIDINRLVGMHRSRMDDYLSQHPGVQSTVIKSWKDLTALMERRREAKRKHRVGIVGISDSELHRLTRGDYNRLGSLVRAELGRLAGC